MIPLNIYPNPATSKLTINLQQLTSLQNTTVSIYDVQGKLLLQQNITQPQTELNIAPLAKGIYILKVNNDTKSMQSKFVKE
ncbi:MAG: T9SS type A sorting domain-containing protein [Bacteroidetes bacterium]|nr:T9SS type A sorting domain-containing protein [Bacteroidota bacterium]